MDIPHLAWIVSIIIESDDPYPLLSDHLSPDQYDAIVRALVTVGKLQKGK